MIQDQASTKEEWWEKSWINICIKFKFPNKTGQNHIFLNHIFIIWYIFYKSKYSFKNIYLGRKNVLADDFILDLIQKYVSTVLIENNSYLFLDMKAAIGGKYKINDKLKVEDMDKFKVEDMDKFIMPTDDKVEDVDNFKELDGKFKIQKDALESAAWLSMNLANTLVVFNSLLKECPWFFSGDKIQTYSPTV